MGADQNFDWQSAAISTLDWWREAGVDVEITDAPRNWLMAVAQPNELATATESAPAQLPATLAAFSTWRIGENAPERAWGSPLVSPSGPADAALTVLIEMPEREDGAEGRLLSGKCGRLFDRMLAAIGLDRDRVHIASIAAARPMSGRIPREAVAPLTAITRRYIELLRPRMLLLLGNAPCQVMLEDLCQQARGRLSPLNQDGATVALASFHPQQLIERPQWKAEAWKDLQMLKAAMDS